MALVLGVAGVLLATAQPALAHANLIRSGPQQNANVEQPPSRVQLWFSERPEVKLTAIQVFASDRSRVDAGPPSAVADEPLALSQVLRPGLPRGVYTVSWRTTSAVDGHVTGGAFVFGIGVTPSPTDQAASLIAQPASSGPLEWLVRWASYLAAVGLLGLALFVVLIAEPSAGLPGSLTQLGAIGERLGRTGQALAGLLVAATVAAILVQANQSSAGLSAGGMAALFGTSLGGILALRLLLGTAIAAGLLVSPRALTPRWPSKHRSLGAAAAPAMQARAASLNIERPLLLVALLAELLLFALSSHALTVSSAPDLALFMDWLHLCAAGLWVGGLVALSVAVLPELGSLSRPAADLQPDDVAHNQCFGPLVAGFSRVALISICGLAATGSYQALVHVGSIDGALTTGYGRAVVVKTAIFGAALLLAAYHRWFLVPLTVQPSRVPATRARRFFSRTLPVEALLAVGILAATGVLTSLAPATVQSGYEQTRSLGAARVTFQILPLQLGQNVFQTTLTSRGKPVDDAEKVELQLTMLDMDMGDSVLDLQPRGNGVYSAEANVIGMSGRWRIELLLRLPGELDKRTTFDLTVKP